MDNKAQVENFSRSVQKIKQEIKKDLVGQEDIVSNVIIAIIAGGNVLLEGVPGVGKTRLVRTLGRVFDLPFSRIQFTPDLMPADVTGTNIIVKDEKGNSQFQFQKGPIFSSIILADEINRATPKTQSALLEAMQEHKVTVMGVSRKLEEPFFVLATQNPIEQDGTYPLPEAQMDRFMFKLLVTYPTMEELAQIVGMTQVTMDEVADAACNARQLLAMRATAKEIPVATEVMTYAMRLVIATQPESEHAARIAKKYIRCGASPRAAQALISAAKVRALMSGRFNVAYSDLNALAFPVLRHRIKLTFEAVTDNVGADDIIGEIINELGHGSAAGVKTEKSRTEEKQPEAAEPSESTDEDKPKRGLFGKKKK